MDWVVDPPTPERAAATKAVVAIWVLFVPPAAVGAVGVPVKPGLASGARGEVAVETAAATKAVVAIWVVLVPPAAVGAVGVPVKVGELL